MTPEREAAQARVIEAVRDLQRKVEDLGEAERRLTEALADLAAAEGNHLRIEPRGNSWRGHAWLPKEEPANVTSYHP